MDKAFKEENLEGFPKLMIKATGELHSIGLELGLDSKDIYPLTLDEQIVWWEKPLHLWPYHSFDEWFFVEEDELEQAVLYDYDVTEFCISIAQGGHDPIHEQDTKEFISIRNLLNNDSHDYSNIRKFLIENPILNLDSPTYMRKIAHMPPNIQEKLVNYLYEAVPKHYYNEGQVYVCPRCGWTLSITNDGDANCDTNKCKKLSSGWYFKSNKLNSQKLLRVRRGIRRYIVDPGLLELNLFKRIEKLQGLKDVILYPNNDEYDLELIFESGTSWLVDVKDWVNPYMLNHNLKPFSTNVIREKAFIVVPSFRGSAYVKTLRSICKKGYEVLDDKQFVKLVKKEGAQFESQI